MQLKRAITLRTVISTSAGLTFATSCFVVSAQVAQALAGDAAWIAVLVAGLLCCLAALSFSELNGLYPTAAGLRLYLQKAWGEKPAITVSLLYMFVVTTVIGAETYVLSRVLERAVPAVSAFWWVVIMLAVACAMNLRGVKVAGAFQDIITFGLVASLIAFAVAALAQGGWELRQPLNTGGAEGLVTAIAVGVFLFIGFEWVTPLAEEVTDNRLIARGMFWAVGLLSVVYALFTVAMGHFLGPGELKSPIPHILFGEKVFGPVGMWWMVLASLAASVTTFNAGLITVSRFMYASAREGVLPRWFGRIHPRFLTPANSILALFFVGLAVSAVVFFTQRYLLLVYVGAAMESIIYAVAGACLLALRRREPNRQRPFRVAWAPVVGWGAIVVFAGLALVTFAESWGAAVYMAVGTVVCWAYVQWVVPRLRAAQAAARPRRPGAAKGAG